MVAFLQGIMAQASAGGTDQLIQTVMMFGGIILIFYFLILRPQKKRQDEHKKVLEALKKGDRVVLSSGFHGTISEVRDTTCMVQIADNVRVTVEKAAIQGLEHKEKKEQSK